MATMPMARTPLGTASTMSLSASVSANPTVNHTAMPPTPTTEPTRPDVSAPTVTVATTTTNAWVRTTQLTTDVPPERATSRAVQNWIPAAAATVATVPRNTRMASWPRPDGPSSLAASRPPTAPVTSGTRGTSGGVEQRTPEATDRRTVGEDRRHRPSLPTTLADGAADDPEVEPETLAAQVEELVLQLLERLGLGARRSGT